MKLQKNARHCLLGILAVLANFAVAADYGVHPGDPAEQYSIAWKYIESKHYQQAFEWSHRAAVRGYAPAQALVGIQYERGDGVTRDYRQAAVWYHRAAIQGEQTNAATYLAKLYFRGLGVPKDMREAAKWFQEGAANGDTFAQTLLGEMYLAGSGVPQDKQQGVMWLKKAAARGERAAQESLDELEREKKLATTLPRQTTVERPPANYQYVPPRQEVRTPVCTLQSSMTASFFNSTGNWSLKRVCK